MAQLTKPQREEFDRLTAERDMARALRWPEYTKPQPMTRAEIDLELKAGNTVQAPSDYRSGPRDVFVGWTFSTYRDGQVYKIGSDGHGHTHLSGSWSQGGGLIYRHKVEAVAALRYEKTEEFAKALAAIDRMMIDADAE
jgi:hypothetical protein